MPKFPLWLQFTFLGPHVLLALPAILLVLLQLPSPVFSTNLYLKRQFGENEFIVDGKKLNCSLNGIDLAAIGLERSCEEWPDLAPIYCDGKIIEAVNYWGDRMLLLRDSKHFVDRPLLKEAKKVVEEFKTNFNVTDWKKFDVSGMSPAAVEQLGKFVRRNFGMADEALISHAPEDWVENPQKFKNITDKKLAEWAKQLNQGWKALSKKMPKDMSNNKGNQKHSLIYVSNPFVVPGGRFREFHYWDAFWIARGLIASGMTKTVKNMCKNFAEMINQFGFVPAGGRIYYSKRSQPPFLTLMVYDYFEATRDTKFLKEMLPTLEKELDFWRTNRSVEVNVQGRKRTYFQYRTKSNMPRPEAFCQDVDLVKDISDPKEKAKVWQNIASTSESGWDFSSRWIRKDDADKKNPWKLTNLMTTKIVPVDLNALICGNLDMLAHLYLQIDDKAKSMAYHGQYQLFLEDFKSLFYKKEHGIWYDFNLDTGRLNEEYYGSAAMPLFARCYDTIDVDTSERMFQRLELFDTQYKMLSQPFGMPSSAITSSHQWDFPNVWPPLQHMLIEGLRRSNNKRMEDQAKELARKWVSATYKLYQKCWRQMWEKMTADTGTPGRGGEYSAQMGFGWTNGAVLDLLVTYGDNLTVDIAPVGNCDNKVVEQEPDEYPNEVSEYREKRLMEMQKKADELNSRKNISWKAAVYEPFALMTEEELKQLSGEKLEKKIVQKKLQLKAFSVHANIEDLPLAFDAREKWPECAAFIGKVVNQGSCGSCWAVSAASTLTDRICIERLKKGIKTDPNDPRAYVSAQYTLESTPGTDGCIEGRGNLAWDFFRDGTVSGTDFEMYSGCKPYTVEPSKGLWKSMLTALDFINDDASWKRKEPSCKKECTKKHLQQQYADGKMPLEPFLHEMEKMPRVIHTAYWHTDGDPNRVRDMMLEIMANGSIQASMETYDDLQMFYTGGIYERTFVGSPMGGHAVKIIGWGEQRTYLGLGGVMRYWLIVNSWGPGWGSNGLFKIRRGSNECNIEEYSINFGFPEI